MRGSAAGNLACTGRGGVSGYRGSRERAQPASRGPAAQDRGPCAWCSAVGRGEEVRLGLFEPVAGQDEVCLFVEERDQAGDGWQLAGGKVVGPGEIWVYRAAVRTGRYLLVVPLWGRG